MTPEREAELRQQGARRGTVLMWHYEAAGLFDELARLRALCEVAAETHAGMLEYAGATNLEDEHYCRLWAASKGGAE